MGSPVATDTESWFGGRVVLTVDTYLGVMSPPVEMVTSVRCVLRRGELVLLMRDAEERRHVLPGGRLEAGESFNDALAREIGEETGYTLAGSEALGACVFTHTTPRPADYGFPYPTFVHLIYRGEAGEPDPALMESGSFEVSSRFVTRSELHAVPLTAGERALVAATY